MMQSHEKTASLLFPCASFLLITIYRYIKHINKSRERSYSHSCCHLFALPHIERLLHEQAPFCMTPEVHVGQEGT